MTYVILGRFVSIEYFAEFKFDSPITWLLKGAGLYQCSLTYQRGWALRRCFVQSGGGWLTTKRWRRLWPDSDNSHGSAVLE